MSITSIAGLPIRRVQDVPTKFNMMVYGDSGVGKTTLAVSSDDIPELRKVLILDIEAGLMSVRNKYPNADSVPIKTWQDMQEVYNAIAAGDTGYSTIIVDSLTEAQKMSMDLIMLKVVAEYEDRNEDVPGVREWNINIQQTRKFVRAFRDLPINTIFTALAKQDKNAKTGAVRTKPSLSGKVADEVAGFLDIVTYMYVKEVDSKQERILLCGATAEVVAKDRTDSLPLTILAPTMKPIWEAVKGLKDNDNATES